MLCTRLILNRDREIAKHAAVGGRGPVVVGSPEEVAEELIAWAEETDVDGFNLAYAVMPETFTGAMNRLGPSSPCLLRPIGSRAP